MDEHQLQPTVTDGTFKDTVSSYENKNISIWKFLREEAVLWRLHSQLLNLELITQNIAFSTKTLHLLSALWTKCRRSFRAEFCDWGPTTTDSGRCPVNRWRSSVSSPPIPHRWHSRRRSSSPRPNSPSSVLSPLEALRRGLSRQTQRSAKEFLTHSFYTKVYLRRHIKHSVTSFRFSQYGSRL